MCPALVARASARRATLTKHRLLGWKKGFERQRRQAFQWNYRLQRPRKRKVWVQSNRLTAMGMWWCIRRRQAGSIYLDLTCGSIAASTYVVSRVALGTVYGEETCSSLRASDHSSERGHIECMYQVHHRTGLAVYSLLYDPANRCCELWGA